MKITKRNGAIHLYDDAKVARSILHANENIPAETITPAMASAFADEVFVRVTKESDIVTTADVRDCVYALLKEKGLTETAKSYIEYKRAKA